MELPASFQTAQASRFYDKTIMVMAQTETTDAEGGVKRTAGQVTETAKANVQPIDAELQKALLGENIEADYRITTAPTISAEKGSLIKYADNIYEAVECKKFDSHAEIIIKRWIAP